MSSNDGHDRYEVSVWGQDDRGNFTIDGSTVQPLEDRRLLATFTVTNLLDAGLGSLRQALINANTGGDLVDDIRFERMLSGTVTLTSGELPIQSSLNIHGPGPNMITVSGNNASRIFNIDDGNALAAIAVEISGLTLTRGNARIGDGGAIRSVENLELSDSVISGNSASGSGGGILMGFLAEDLILSNTTISGNSAGSEGGGFHAFNVSTITIMNSTISENTASSDGGGFYAAHVGSMAIVDSTVTSNSAAGSGGGMRLSNSSGTVTIDGSSISHNSATSQGGGMAAISYLQATTTITDSTISGNSAGTTGGGIAASNLFGGGATTIADSSVTGNSGHSGGGIWSSNSGSLTIVGSTVSMNSSTFGGGISVLDDGGTTTMQKCTVSGNSAALIGGGMSLTIGVGGSMAIDNTTIFGNLADASSGGGIASTNYRGAMTIDSTTITGNSAAADGGGIQIQTYLGSVAIDRSTISSNWAGSEGGGIYDSNTSPTSLNGSIIAGNIATTDGPDLFPSRSALDVAFSLIGHNAGSGLSEAPVGLPDSHGNLIGGPLNGTINPLLGPLADNGGPTPSRSLLSGSPAIDAGNPAFVPPPLYDQRAAPFSRVFAGRIDMGAIEFIEGDFNHDGVYDCADVNALVATIAANTHDPTYDLNSDLLVNLEDLDTWLAVAGAASLPSHRPYLKGDADLNGVVDGSDFNAWNANKFTNTAAWCSGDFNANGVVDGSDFNIWNNNNFQSSLASSPIDSQLRNRHALGKRIGPSTSPERLPIEHTSATARRLAALRTDRCGRTDKIDRLWADEGIRSFRECHQDMNEGVKWFSFAFG